MTLQSRTVLIDLERQEVGEQRLAVGLHPLQLSPARLPAALHGDDLARMRAYAQGEAAACEALLSFRLQDLDDLGVPTLQINDCITGVFDPCGTKLVELPAGRPLWVAATFVGGGGVSLGRPGRHLLCAQFTSDPPRAAVVALPALPSVSAQTASEAVPTAAAEAPVD